MITKFKIFENTTESNIIEVDLNDIFRQSKWSDKVQNFKNVVYVKRDHEFIIDKLNEIFLGKYIYFENDKYFSGVNTTNLLYGIVEEIMYDNDWGNKIVYFKFKNDNTFYSIKENTIVRINLALTDAEKYNL